MKLSKVRKCDNCGGPLAAAGGGVFNVVRVTTAMVMPGPYQRLSGLAMMFGGSVSLAEAMSPEPDVIMVMGDEAPELMTELLICRDCYMMNDLSIAVMVEKRNTAAAQARGVKS